MKPSFLLAAAFAGLLTLSARGEIVPLTNVTVDSPNSFSARLGGVKVKITNAATANIFTTDLTTSDYAFAPITASTPTVSYSANSKLKIEFELPVTGLLFYPVYFRGIAADAPIPTVAYAFPQPFTIESGLSDASRVGGTLLVGTSTYYSGIIRFPGTLSSLDLDTNAGADSAQALFLAVDDAAPKVSAAAKVRVKAGAKTALLRGTASAPLGIRKVEARLPGKKIKLATGREKWTLRVPVTGAKTVVQIRATSGSGKVSAVKKITVVRPAK